MSFNTMEMIVAEYEARMECLREKNRRLMRERDALLGLCVFNASECDENWEDGLPPWSAIEFAKLDEMPARRFNTKAEADAWSLNFALGVVAAKEARCQPK